jgi:hypothetical protein
MVVILYSGICVLEGLVALQWMGVYASAGIKKSKYWPKHVPGDAMDGYMNNQEHNKKVGDTAALKGVLDGIPYNLFCTKDVDCNMKQISTYGALVSAPCAPDKQRTMPDGTKVTIKYTTPIKNHYLYWHARPSQQSTPVGHLRRANMDHTDMGERSVCFCAGYYRS